MSGNAQPFPVLAKFGLATIAFGLASDLVEHSLALPATGSAGAGFSVGEHAAHLVVLAGMVIVLLGVVADGVRASGRANRPEGSSRDAVR